MSAPFAAAQQEDAFAQFEQGQNAHEAGETAKALQFYEKAIELFPDFPEAEYQRGTALQQLNRPAEAEKAFRRALELRADWSLPAAKLGALLVDNKNYVEAEQVLQTALKLDADNSPSLIALTELYLRTNAAPGKLKNLLVKVRNQTEGKFGATASLWAARGALERSLTDKIAAKISVSKALRIDAKNLSARLEQAELFLSEGDFTAALDDAKIALEIAPDDLTAKLLTARIHSDAGKPEESLKILNALSAAEKKLPEVLKLRDVVIANGASDTASVAELEKLVADEPKNAVILGRLCALSRTLNPTRALDYCRRASELEPNNVAHAVGFGAALVQARRFTEAVQILTKIMNFAPDNYTARANLAVALYKSERFAEAVGEFEKMLAVKPENAVSYYFMGSAHDRLENYLDAMAAYQKFLALADAKQNQFEIDTVRLRLPSLSRQIEKGVGKKKPRT